MSKGSLSDSFMRDADKQYTIDDTDDQRLETTDDTDEELFEGPLTKLLAHHLRSPIHCIFLFRRPMLKSDHVTKYFSGQFVHMETLVFLTNNPNDSPTFTTFMGENFSMSVSAKYKYSSKYYEALMMETFPDEAFSLFAYFIELTEREVPYNLSDLFLLPLKKLLKSSELFNDVPTESPKHLKKVFCSQAFTLALRNCLTNKNYTRLLERLKQENSRLVTPTDFYDIVRPYCKRINVDRLSKLVIERC